MSYGAGSPYQPYVDLLRAAVGAEPGSPIEAVASGLEALAIEAGLGKEVPFLLRLIGVHGAGNEESGIERPELVRAWTHDAVVALLTALSDRQPLMIAIDDVHWADPASVDLTEFVVRQARGLALAVAVAARPEGRPVVERIANATHRRTLLIDPERLSDDAVATITESVLGGPTDPQLTAMVAARTAGNPLFVQEVVRSLRESGCILEVGGRWCASTDAASHVPETIEHVLAARIDMLPRDAADVLQVASVLGRDVHMPLLREVMQADRATLGSLVDLLVQREFLDRIPDDGVEPRLVFHHALVVDVAYGRLLRRQRRTLHRAVFNAALDVSGSGDDVIDLLAHHAYLGEIGAVALPFVTRAARRAAGLFANTDAIRHLDHAIEIARAGAGGHPELPELMMEIASLEARVGNFERALSWYEAVRASTHDLRAYVGEARALGTVARYREAHEVLDSADRDHADATPQEAAAICIERGLVLGRTGDPQAAKRVLAVALESLNEDGSAIEAAVLIHLAQIETILGDLEVAIEHGTRAAALLETQNDLPGLANALRILGASWCDLSHEDAEAHATAVEILERALAVARQVGHAEEEGAALTNLGRLWYQHGRVDDAVQCNLDAIAAFERVGIHAGVACAYCNLADAYTELGRLDDAETAARAALAVAEHIGQARWTAGALHGMANIHALRGNDDLAIQHGKRAAALYSELGARPQLQEVEEIMAQARRRLLARSPA
jgi:tetratricopeptide (TPR) repeat protein